MAVHAESARLFNPSFFFCCSCRTLQRQEDAREAALKACHDNIAARAVQAGAAAVAENRSRAEREERLMAASEAKAKAEAEVGSSAMVGFYNSGCAAGGCVCIGGVAAASASWIAGGCHIRSMPRGTSMIHSCAHAAPLLLRTTALPRRCCSLLLLLLTQAKHAAEVAKRAAMAAEMRSAAAAAAAAKAAAQQAALQEQTKTRQEMEVGAAYLL
jgi:hypothetical protein